VDCQKDQNQTDAEYAQARGIGVASLRAWRAKFKNQEPAAVGANIVEVDPLSRNSCMPVILPNGIRIEVTLEPSFLQGFHPDRDSQTQWR
jgi:hypothetical protein